MPETLAPPPPATATEASEVDSLKANFNTALQTETGVDPKASTDDTPTPDAKPALVPKTDPKADESIVPDQFTGKPKEEKKEDAAEILSAEERGQLRSKLGGKAQESFDRMEMAAKAKIAALQAQAEELRQKLATVPQGPSKEHEEAVKAANERAQKLEQQLERAKYSDSPKFQKFGAEITAEIDSAKAYLEGTQVSPSVLEVAASQSGQSRLKTMRDAGLDAETIAAVGPHLARADAIRRERDSSLENWKADHTKEIEQQRHQQAQQEAQRQAQEEAVFKTVGERMRKELEGFQKVDGHDKWNATVDQNDKDAAEFFAGKKSLEELAEIAYEGVSARTTRLINKELKRMLNAANEENSRLKAAQPGTGHTAVVNGDATKPMDDEAAFKANFNNALAQVRG